MSSARWEAILADLTERGVAPLPDAPDQVLAVTWRDGSLGCPEPGMRYPQALVLGQRVLLSAAGRTWDYRFGRGDVPTLCDRPG